MLIKKLLLSTTIILPLAFASAAYAVTVPSDYAKDVRDGSSQLQSDQNAQAQASNVNDAEKVEGQIDDGQVQVDQTIGSQESTMDDAQSGESHDGASSGMMNGSDSPDTVKDSMRKN
ncbi:MAG: hypothetical protein NVS1B7_4870 [Candidatus Saccharimonadales bacterium]